MRTLALPKCGVQGGGHVFSVSLSFEQGQAAISICAELKPAHLNLVIFLGDVQGTKERQWWKLGPPTSS